MALLIPLRGTKGGLFILISMKVGRGNLRGRKYVFILSISSCKIYLVCKSILVPLVLSFPP